MRRWNGWGDEAVDYSVKEELVGWLAERVGAARPPVDQSLAQAVAAVPASRLAEHRLLSLDPEVRLRHAAGQSFPDWVAIRSGRVTCWPDAVAMPGSAEEVRAVLRLAEERGARVLPWGGGTSVVGHFRVEPADRPVVSLSLARMNRLLALDARGCLATFEAGVAGPTVEDALEAHGFTLGHFPQSFELSTLGGWVATRSSGQLSRRYGRIEDLFAGGQVETPRGRLVAPPFPASAAGPDLRQLILGSEGRLGVITQCQVKVTPKPERQEFRGCFFPSAAAGMTAVREAAQSGLPIAMMRLSLPIETETSLALSQMGAVRHLLDVWLALHRIGSDKCMLLYGATGTTRQVRHTLAEAEAIYGRHGAARVGRSVGDKWERTRFHYPYLRNTMWERGYATDTLETAVPWMRVPQTVERVERALRSGLEADGERVHAFTHLSHVYPHGSSLYTSYVFRLADDPDLNLDRWRRLKAAASQAIVKEGGTISHQHGVGQDHRPYLGAEKGELGMELLRASIGCCDPDGLMNTGNLIGQGGDA